jgi:hypothetical protein
MPSVCALLRVEAHRQHLRRLAGRVSIPEPGLLVRGLLRRHSAPGVRDEFRTWRRLAPGELVAVDLLRRLPLSVGGHTAGEPSAIGDGGAGALEVPGPRGASKGTDGTEDVRLLSLLPPCCPERERERAKRVQEVEAVLEVPGPRGSSKGTDGTEDVRLLSLPPSLST